MLIEVLWNPRKNRVIARIVLIEDRANQEIAVLHGFLIKKFLLYGNIFLLVGFFSFL